MSKFCDCDCHCSHKCCDCLTLLLWGFCPCCCFRKCHHCDCKKKRRCPRRKHGDWDWEQEEEWKGGWDMRRDSDHSRNDSDRKIFNTVLKENDVIEADFSERNSSNFGGRFPIPREDATALAYITTSGLVDGFNVPAGGRIPLTTLRLNDDNIITLNDDTIRFNRPGLYKIDFVIATFTSNPNQIDQIAIGFRHITEPQTIFTAGMRITTQSNLIVGTGALRVRDTQPLYELINLNDTPIRLESFQGETVLTASNVVNMTITYLSD